MFIHFPTPYYFCWLDILLPQITSFFMLYFRGIQTNIGAKIWMNLFVSKKELKNNNIKHFFMYVRLWCVMRLIFHQSLTLSTPSLCSTTFFFFISNKQNNFIYVHLYEKHQNGKFLWLQNGIIKIYNAVWIQEQRNEMMEMEG